MIQEIIQQYNNLDSLYGNKLTNHLNMGLFALYKMGASKERLHEFAKAYIEYNQIPKTKDVKVHITFDNFDQIVGVDGYYSSFISFYQRELAEKNLKDVVHHYLNKLIDGEAGGAFHGIIRMAYAYELGDEDEIAKELSYLTESYQAFDFKKIGAIA